MENEKRFNFNEKTQMWAVGNTLVFLKQSVYDTLEKSREGSSGPAVLETSGKTSSGLVVIDT